MQQLQEQAQGLEGHEQQLRELYLGFQAGLCVRIPQEQAVDERRLKSEVAPQEGPLGPLGVPPQGTAVVARWELPAEGEQQPEA